MPTAAEWIAADDPLCGQPGAMKCPMSLDGLDSIFGTRRLEPAEWQQTHRPEQDAVQTNPDDEKILEAALAADGALVRLDVECIEGELRDMELRVAAEACDGHALSDPSGV